MFDRLGVVRYPASAATADAMFEAALEAGASDVESGPVEHEILSAPESLNDVREALTRKFGEPSAARLEWRPQTRIPVDGDPAVTLLRLIEVLEDNDDVQAVYANFDIPDAVFAKLTA